MDKQKVMGIVAGVTIVLAIAIFLLTRSGGNDGGGGVPPAEPLPEVTNESALARPTDVHMIVAAVKAKGEQYVTKIAVGNAEACEVTVADGSREGKSGRKYKVTKKGGAWEVGEKPVTWG